MGTLERLMPHVRTRFRGSEIVPFISQPMPTRENFQIAEIVVGPAAPDGTERDLTTMLRSIGIDVNFPIGRSDIPYRA